MEVAVFLKFVRQLITSIPVVLRYNGCDPEMGKALSQPNLFGSYDWFGSGSYSRKQIVQRLRLRVAITQYACVHFDVIFEKRNSQNYFSLDFHRGP